MKIKDLVRTNKSNLNQARVFSSLKVSDILKNSSGTIGVQGVPYQEE